MTGHQFKNLREAAGLTQPQMAQLLHYGSFPRISEIEARGPSKVSNRVIERMQLYAPHLLPAKAKEA